MIVYRLDTVHGISTNVINESLSEKYFIPIVADEPYNNDALQDTKFPYVLNFPLITDDANNFIGYDKPINISGTMIPVLDAVTPSYGFNVIIHLPLESAAFGTPVGNTGIIVAYNPYYMEYETFTAQETDIEIPDYVIKQYAPWNNKVIIPE